MNSVTEDKRHGKRDFYTSTLAPVNDRRRVPFRPADAVILIVLFLELGIVVRLFLAN